MKYLLFILPLFYMVVATNFFGNNWFSQSSAELICDGLGIIMFILCFGILKLEDAIEKKNNKRK